MERTTWLVLPLVLAACSPAGGGGGGDDNGGIEDQVAPSDHVTDTGALDVLAGDSGDAYDIQWCAADGGFGCPCAEDSSCKSGKCAWHMGDRVCSVPCSGGCPGGWECAADGNQVEGAYCRSEFPSLCLPCLTSAECAAVGGGSCIEYPDGVGFACGTDCSGDGSCPAGYDCAKVRAVEGEESMQCRRDDPAGCPCSPAAVAVGAVALCTATSQWGSCAGERSCTAEGLAPCTAPIPAEEICDGIDNDCDGTTDEDPAGGDKTGLCDDANPCTSDSCGGAQGCLHAPDDTASCIEEDVCTLDEKCQDGACVFTPLDCDDGVACTDDTCSPSEGCQHAFNSAVVETDGNPCTQDTCNEGTVVCKPLPDNELCDDFDPCSLQDHCVGGHCLSFAHDYVNCPDTTCGDLICKFPDSADNCPEDCGSCGDGTCSKSENGPNGGSCPNDCLPACGNGKCEGGEDFNWCLVDCGSCGDKFCGKNENHKNCAGDCPATCGNGECETGEDEAPPKLCPQDCSPPCGNAECEFGETPQLCPVDCPVCGDGICGNGEDKANCPKDCIVPCGNGICEGGENPDNCAVDCGACGDGVCGKKEEEGGYCPMDCPVGCGDGICDEGETKAFCPKDCCFPSCVGKECGNDGCGGSCGTCETWCSEEGFCCVPDCTDKECGDDGCGGSCGSCNDKKYCTTDECTDFKCHHPLIPFQCLIGSTCVPAGTENPLNSCQECSPDQATGKWTPGPDGVPCGDGKVCYQGSCCNHNGNCAGKVCGDDQCGSTCGLCPLGLVCLLGQCVECDDGNLVNWDGCTSGSISEFLVNKTTVGEERWPTVTPIAGGFVIAWHGFALGGPYPAIMAQRFSTGKGKTGTELKINSTSVGTPDAFTSWGPVAAGYADGDFAVAWNQYDGSGYANDVFARTYKGDGTPASGPFQVNSTKTGSQFMPRLAALPDKQLFSVWVSMDQDGDDAGVYARMFDFSGTALTGEVLVNQVTAAAQSEPSVARLNDGRLVVVWTDFDNSGFAEDIWGRFFTAAGAAESDAFLIAGEASVQEEGPDVCATSGGGFAVVWTASGPVKDSYPDGDGKGVFGVMLDAAGKKVGGFFPVNGSLTGHQFQPRIAGLSGGKIGVAWTTQTLADGMDVSYRIFDSAGGPLTGEQRANTYQVDDQWYPSVSAAGPDAFLVAWETVTQDGDKSGVAAVRIDILGVPIYF